MSEPNISKEDTHFYIDNAHPNEVSNVLRVLSTQQGLTSIEIAEILDNEYGYKMQKDRSYSPRRLYDLGLAERRRSGGKVIYILAALGVKLQNIQATDINLALDLLHFLHYSGYSGRITDRKYLWSYKRCCEYVWAQKEKIAYDVLASMIQTEMQTNFPHLDFSASIGARFNNTAARCVFAWLEQLNPPPFEPKNKKLVLRTISRYELVLLALDYTYKARGYRYGDAVLLDERLANDVASVFFLDPQSCISLLRFSTRFTSKVKLADTLAGVSINLYEPYSIEDV